MKRLWNVLFVLSWIPLIWPFLLCFYSMTVESWKMFDFLVLYSFIYWPTYVFGFVIMMISFIMLKKKV